MKEEPEERKEQGKGRNIRQPIRERERERYIYIYMYIYTKEERGTVADRRQSGSTTKMAYLPRVSGGRANAGKR